MCLPQPLTQLFWNERQRNADEYKAERRLITEGLHQLRKHVRLSQILKYYKELMRGLHKDSVELHQPLNGGRNGDQFDQLEVRWVGKGWDTRRIPLPIGQQVGKN